MKCAICHRTFPTDIMVAAHIKPRSKCTTQERKNPNVVMPVCKVGCDDFFEKGYLLVDQDGVVRLNEKMTCSSELQTILNLLTGNQCTHFNNETEDFFYTSKTVWNRVNPRPITDQCALTVLMWVHIKMKSEGFREIASNAYTLV